MVGDDPPPLRVTRRSLPDRDIRRDHARAMLRRRRMEMCGSTRRVRAQHCADPGDRRWDSKIYDETQARVGPHSRALLVSPQSSATETATMPTTRRM
jgi:hypothetical protein